MNKTMSKIYIMITAILFAVTSVQAEPVDTVIDTLQLDRIVVTASKIPLSQRETTKPVTIIDRWQIEQSGSRNIGQLLNKQSGIRVNDSYGSPANPQILFLQGASAQYTLVLVDGLAINDPSGTGGVFDLRSLPLNNVEQIEILKGSQSTLYGSDAIAGVINIITKSGDEGLINGSGEISYGSYNSFHGSAGIGGTVNENVRYTLNVKRESSDGFSAAADPGNTGAFGDDGFLSTSFYGKLDIKPVESLTISPFLNFNDFEGDYDDGAFQDADNEFMLRMFNPGVQVYFVGENLSINGGYNYTQTERSFISQFGENNFEGRFNNADFYGAYQFSNTFQFLAGINHQDAMMPGNDGQERFDSRTTSPYATFFIKDWYGFSTELGYRLNNHSEYGSNSTYSFAPAYNITDNVKLFGSVTTGFKAPTLSDLFGPFGANPDLDPQTSRYISGGIESYLLDQSLKLSAQYFNREISDLIIYTFDLGFINRDRQNDSGFEMTADWIAGQSVRLGAHYNYVTGALITLDEGGNELRQDNLIRRPAHNAGANLSVNIFENLLVRIDGEYNSERTDMFFNPENDFAEEEVILDAYTLINLYAGYRFLNNQITVFADIRNLFDSDFTEIYGFNTAGFTIKGGLRLNF
jgi:vitamin B12 transporter